jgi:hypothetical protein
MMRRTAGCCCGGLATSCEGFSARPVEEQSRSTAETSAATFSLAGPLRGVRAALGEAADDPQCSPLVASSLAQVGRG